MPRNISKQDAGQTEDELWIEMAPIRGSGERSKLKKGQPYGRVKEKARYMASSIPNEVIGLHGNLDGALDMYERIIAKLIETCPQQTLDALCEVLDPDATT